MDASENGLGAVLYQKQSDDTDHIIAYASQTLSKSEKSYDAHKLKFLALEMVSHWKLPWVSTWWRIWSLHG